MRALLGVVVPDVLVDLAFLRVGVFFSLRIFLLMWLELDEKAGEKEDVVFQRRGGSEIGGK